MSCADNKYDVRSYGILYTFGVFAGSNRIIHTANNWRREAVLSITSSCFFASMERSLEPLNRLQNQILLSIWHERFALYAITNDRINDDNRVAFYLTLIGKDAYNLLKDLSYPNALNTQTVAQLQASLQGHLCPTNFATSERARFHTLIRRPGETMRLIFTTATATSN